MLKKILILVLFLSSCREKVYDSFPPFDKVPTVNSFLTRDSVIAVHVSMATKIEKGSIDGVDNAIVRVYSDNGVDMVLPHEGDGWYKASLSAETGEAYHCEVTVPGFPTVFSSTQIPSEPVFLNLQHIAIAGKDEEGITYPAMSFTFANNPDEIVYFEAVIRLFEYESIINATLLNISDPILLEEGLPIALFSNATITGNNYTMVLNYTTGSAGSTGVDGEWRTTLYPFVFELRKVSKSYYLHKRSLKLYETGRYPEFALGGNPVFNVYSNVENGYGIFAAYSSILSDTIYPSY